MTTTNTSNDVVLTMSLLGQQGTDDGFTGESTLNYKDGPENIKIDEHSFPMGGSVIHHHAITGSDDEIMKKIIVMAIETLAGTRAQGDTEKLGSFTEALYAKYLPA